MVDLEENDVLIIIPFILDRIILYRDICIGYFIYYGHLQLSLLFFILIILHFILEKNYST